MFRNTLVKYTTSMLRVCFLCTFSKALSKLTPYIFDAIPMNASLDWNSLVSRTGVFIGALLTHAACIALKRVRITPSISIQRCKLDNIEHYGVCAGVLYESYLHRAGASFVCG